MKTVYLVRHAKSSWDDPSLHDSDRPLNKRGKRDAPFMAKLFADRGLRPDALVSSPAVRAFTTAKHFAKALGFRKEDIVQQPAIYEAMSSDILRLVQQDLREEWQTVLLFGHNPTFTIFANQFDGRHIDNIPTCGVVKLSGPIDHWRDFYPGNGIRLEEFVYPKQFLS